MYLLGENQIAVIYTNKTTGNENKGNRNDNKEGEEYDVFKLIYKYELVDNNPYILNITSLDYLKSSFLLSANTAKDNKCDNFNTSIPHSLNDTVCDKNADKLTYVYPTPFIATISSNVVESRYFKYTLTKECII